MGIGLGLGAAVSWGLADYFAALASRRVGTLPVVLGLHLVACVFLGVLVAATGELSLAAWTDVPFFLLVGVLGFGSYLTFYRALAIGPISVVSPIVSGYAAVTVLLAVIVRGERLSAGEAAAIALVVGGVVLTTLDLGRLGGSTRAGGLGIVLAVATTVLIGGFVFGVADRTDRLGWLVPIFLARLASTVFVAAATAARGEPRPRGWPPSILATLLFLGVVDTAGYISFNVGVRHAATSVVATASAPYALIPIALGVLLLRERPARSQWAGVAAVLVGLVLLGLVS